MTKNIIVVGAGGLGREIIWMLENINVVNQEWNVLGFVDDNMDYQGKSINSYEVLGTIRWLADYKEDIYVTCAIGNPRIRAKVIEILSTNQHISFPVLVAPDVKYSNSVMIGDGSILCTGSIATVNIIIGEHVIINPNCTIGHDAIIHDFAILYPNVNVSGNVTIGSSSKIGVGTQVIQGITIGESTIVGAGSVVIRDIPGHCTAVGVPARVIKGGCLFEQNDA